MARMMKRAAVIAALATLLVASAGFAPCFYPESRHFDYYQYHSSCGHEPPCGPWEPTITYWSLDGTCDTDCANNTSCQGDTHVDSMTIIDVTTGPCDPICE